MFCKYVASLFVLRKGQLGLWNEGRDEGAKNGKMKGLQAYSRRIGDRTHGRIE